MKYIITLKYETKIPVEIEAPDATIALSKLTKNLQVDEIYPKTEDEAPYAEAKYSEIGLNSEPFIPDSLRNKLLLLLADLFLSTKASKPHMILESHKYINEDELLESFKVDNNKLKELDNLIKHIKIYYAKSL